MAYIGVQPTAGQYRKLDNISASFNGSTTSFTTSVGGTNVTAGTAQQLIVSLGGVIQQPDTDYTVSTNTITFTTAPTSGLDFFAILMGDALNTVTPSDGSVTTSKLAGSLSVGLTAGSASTPALFFTGDTNNGIFSPSTDAIAVTTAGSERLRVTSAGLVGIGTSSPSNDLHVSGTTGAKIQNSASTNAQFVLNYASNNPVLSLYDTGGTQAVKLHSNGSSWLTGGSLGIGTTSPAQVLDVQGGANRTPIAFKGSGTGTGYLYADNSSFGVKTSAGSLTATDAFVGVDTANTILFITSGTEKAKFDSSGRLLVGTSSARTDFASSTATPRIQQEATDYNGSSLSLVRNSNNGGNGELIFGKSRGTSLGGVTVVAADDTLGGIRFDGADGTDFATGALISAQVDGTPGNNDMPGRLVFSTTADGASSPTERLRIANNGQLSAVVPGNSTLYPGFMARAWVSFNGTGTVAIIGSGNVSSITDNGVGIYAVNFTTALPDGNYAVATGFKRIATSSEFVNVGFSNSTTSFNVEFFAGGGNVDTSNMQLVIFR